MNHVRMSKMFIVSCAVAAAAACNNTNRTADMGANTGTNGNNTPPAAATNTEATPKPITVTGCLQEAGQSYVLTRLNEPSEKSVGTTGTPAEVEHEQLREARNAYRVDPTGDVKIDDMVGKQVRVSGTIADKADLPSPEAAAAPNGNKAAGNADTSNVKRPDIDAGDLAKIDATSVSVVSNECGNQAAAASKSPSKSSSSRNRKR